MAEENIRETMLQSMLEAAADPDRCHRCIGTGQIVPKLNFNLMYKMICSTQLTINLSRFCPIKASNVTICIICYKTKVNNADSQLKMPNEQFYTHTSTLMHFENHHFVVLRHLIVKYVWTK